MTPKEKALKAKTSEEYFRIPKEEREENGFYILPLSLRWSVDSFMGKGVSEWGLLMRGLRKEYPIQWFFRDWLFTIDNPVFYVSYKVKGFTKDKFRNVKRFFFPEHRRFHKVYRRWEYRDLNDVIEETLFAIMLDFWYGEVVDGIVDWESDDAHRDFYNWLKDSIGWIENTLPKYIEKKDALLSKFLSDDENHNEYFDICRKIEKETEGILVTMMSYRGMFWT